MKIEEKYGITDPLSSETQSYSFFVYKNMNHKSILKALPKEGQRFQHIWIEKKWSKIFFFHEDGIRKLINDENFVN